MVAFTAVLGLLAASTGVMAQLRYLGVAMAGIDFGCDIDGSCPVSKVQVPLASLGGADSAGQMKHFVEDDGMNAFRLSMTWQYITASQQPSAKLDKANWAKFDKLVQACLATGAHCMLDLHNFARNKGIIGQGGPSDQVFAALWTQIATHYAKEDKIIFGLMNEPHDLGDVETWARTCQAAVAAIRNAGAASQTILLPGTDFTSAATFVSSGSAEALAAVTNPDGSTDNLLMDIHKYLDENNSGSNAECTTNNVAAFETLVDWLRKNKRLAVISETGASMDPTCMTRFCEQNEFIAKNDDVLVGFVGWAAGGFDSTYLLTLTPSRSGNTWTDNKLMKKCILGPFGKPAGGDGENSTATSTSTRPALAPPSRQTSAPSDPATPVAETSDRDNGNLPKDNSNGSSQIIMSTLGILTLACVTTLHLF